MILRKPYAFFIKYFRIINLIMALLMGVLIYRTFVLGKFFSTYAADYTTASSGFVLGNYINIYSFIMALIVIIFNIVVLSVLFVKDKPKKLYIINLILFIGVMILFGVDYSVLRGINEAILDIRVSKALRDITYIIAGLEVVVCLLTLIRATGFDIKSFDFSTDLQQLEIDTKDNEEFEVAVEFDGNKIKRNIRRNFRNMKYVYHEHKFLINVSAIIFVVIIAFLVFVNRGIYRAEYKQGKAFQASGIVANVQNTYLTQNDEDGNLITYDNQGNLSRDRLLVIVKMDIRKSVADENKTLNTGLITLRVGDHSYSQTTAYNDKLTDIGTGYVDQKLDTEFTSYTLTFNIPKTLADHKMTLKVNDNVSYVKGEIGAKNIYVKLEPEDLTASKETTDSKLGEEQVFTGSILGDSALQITQIAIGNKFKVEYDFCAKKDNCYKSYEYITPTATGNYAKTLLRIVGNFSADESMNFDELDTMYQFLNRFATIYYKIGDKWYSHEINSKLIKPAFGQENNVTYIEVNKDVEKASSIYFTFNVRNYSYKYVIK